MESHVRTLAASALLSLLLAGCHGAGSSGGVVPSNVQQQGVKTASFTVYVPAAAPGLATPVSLAVTLLQVNGVPYATKAAPFTMNLTPSTKGCTPAGGGALSCTATVPAPGGNDTFSLTTFTGLNGTGKQIATSQARAMVTASPGTKCTPAPNTAKGVAR